MIKATATSNIIEILDNELNSKQRNTIKEITLDMAGSMNSIAQVSFRRATSVTR